MKEHDCQWKWILRQDTNQNPSPPHRIRSRQASSHYEDLRQPAKNPGRNEKLLQTVTRNLGHPEKVTGWGIREMADYSVTMCHFDVTNLHYYTIHPKSERPVKSVIRQRPGDTPKGGMSNETKGLDFSVITFHQMMAKHIPPHGSIQDFIIPL
jgi:hypothetical protein